MRVLTAGALFALALGTPSCASRPELAVQAGTPPLAIERYFPGRTEGQGKFVNVWTGYERVFDVVITGQWDGKTLVLVEDFRYADGVVETKTWRLVEVAPGRFEGAREDVIGTAVGFVEGGQFRLEYDMDVAGYHLRFRDVMGLEDPQTLINLATVSWWGIKVGRVELRLVQVPQG